MYSHPQLKRDCTAVEYSRVMKSANDGIVFEECHWRTASTDSFTMFKELAFYYQIPCFQGAKKENLLLFRDVNHVTVTVFQLAV
jgi:hypothetical protein